MAEFEDRLPGLSAAVREAVSQTLFSAADKIRVEAQTSITRGAVSGKEHKPSRPGDPPSADTHHLADNIEAVQTGPLTAEVSSNASYSVHLEYGTSRIAERPFMRPAVQNAKPDIDKLLRKAVRNAVRKQFRG